VRRSRPTATVDSEIQAYRRGPNAFEFKGTTGFMITYDITSKDVTT